jgi:hypothetical protein
MNLKKQSQCQNGKNDVNSLIARIYEGFYGFGRFWATKNKAKQSQYYRSEFGVLRTATRILKKQSQSVRKALPDRFISFSVSRLRDALWRSPQDCVLRAAWSEKSAFTPINRQHFYFMG